MFNSISVDVTYYVVSKEDNEQYNGDHIWLKVVSPHHKSYESQCASDWIFPFKTGSVIRENYIIYANIKEL